MLLIWNGRSVFYFKCSLSLFILPLDCFGVLQNASSISSGFVLQRRFRILCKLFANRRCRILTGNRRLTNVLHIYALLHCYIMPLLREFGSCLSLFKVEKWISDINTISSVETLNLNPGLRLKTVVSEFSDDFSFFCVLDCRDIHFFSYKISFHFWISFPTSWTCLNR